MSSTAVSITAVSNSTADLTIPMPLKFPSLAMAAQPDRPLVLRIGYDMQFELLGPQPTAMLLLLYVHPDVSSHLNDLERLVIEPTGTEVETFTDSFGNRCGRIVAPPGPLRLT